MDKWITKWITKFLKINFFAKFSRTLDCRHVSACFVGARLKLKNSGENPFNAEER